VASGSQSLARGSVGDVGFSASSLGGSGGDAGFLAGVGTGIDRAEVQRSEGAGAEGAQRVERRDEGVGVLQEQAAGGGEREDGAQSAVEGFDLYLTVAREDGGALEREGEARGERQVVGVGEGDVVARRGVLRLAEQRDDGPRRGDGDGQREHAAIVQSDLRGEAVVDVDGGCGGGGGEREAQRGGVRFAVARGLGREDEVAEGELVDLVEARSGEEQGAVAGVEFDGGDVGGLGEGARGELVGAGLVVLLDGEMEVAGGEVVLLRQGEREPIRVVVIGVGLKGDVECRCRCRWDAR
jgi:hypothetical protein